MGVLRYSVSGPNSADNPHLAAVGAAATGFFGTREQLRRNRLEEESIAQEQAAQEERLRQYDRNLQIAEDRERRLAEMEQFDQDRFAQEQEARDQMLGAMQEMPPERRRMLASLSEPDFKLAMQLELQAQAKAQEQEQMRGMANRAAVMAQAVPNGEAFMQMIADPNLDPEERHRAFMDLREEHTNAMEQQQLGAAMETVTQLMQAVDPFEPAGEMLSQVHGALLDGNISPSMALGALKPFAPELEQSMRGLGMDTPQIRAAQIAASQQWLASGGDASWPEMVQGAAEQSGLMGGGAPPMGQAPPVEQDPPLTGGTTSVREHPEGPQLVSAFTTMIAQGATPEELTQFAAENDLALDDSLKKAAKSVMDFMKDIDLRVTATMDKQRKAAKGAPKDPGVDPVGAGIQWLERKGRALKKKLSSILEDDPAAKIAEAITSQAREAWTQEHQYMVGRPPSVSAGRLIPPQ